MTPASRSAAFTRLFSKDIFVSGKGDCYCAFLTRSSFLKIITNRLRFSGRMPSLYVFAQRGFRKSSV